MFSKTKEPKKKNYYSKQKKDPLVIVPLPIPVLNSNKNVNIAIYSLIIIGLF
jgi:hypothetical protein